METLEKSIDVNAQLHEVYNQWTQFEEFPKFMQGVEEVRQLSDKRLFWKAKLWGKTEEWEAEIYEQVPDQRIAWRSVTGAPNAGAVSFKALSPGKTQVTLSLSYQPLGITEQIGDALGLVSGRIEGDLKRFQDFIEERGRATGAWRGEIR
ncbi:MAG: cyclase/dehydrase [Chthoniobacteraceae bacterium]|nr:cyclase/dehydrase [Chthoniobacteraceae bacterium]MDB6175688.1 cyclase/dehydrase [Chthoniobacteraceae bacterium]